MEFVGKVAGRGPEYEGKAGRGITTARKAGATKEGVSRMMFGCVQLSGNERSSYRSRLIAEVCARSTDHPFFPPLNGGEEPWQSVVQNLDAIEQAEGWDEADRAGVRGENAVRLFALVL